MKGRSRKQFRKTLKIISLILIVVMIISSSGSMIFAGTASENGTEVSENPNPEMGMGGEN